MTTGGMHTGIVVVHPWAPPPAQDAERLGEVPAAALLELLESLAPYLDPRTDALEPP